jgi:LPXTG-motif cell wall-anchored protein
MRNRLRLGAAASVGLGALLLATVLASPALAWHSNVAVEANCLDDGSVVVDFTVTAFEEGHEATVDVFYTLNGEKTGLVSDAPLNDELSGQFDLPPGTTGTLTVVAVVDWEADQKDSRNKDTVELPKCEDSTTTSTAPPTTAPPTTAPPTTAPPTTAPESTVSPSTSLETTTTGAAVGGATSTTAGGGQLPFTGASSGPMLLAGIVLVGGGALFLLVSRIRDRHAA